MARLATIVARDQREGDSGDYKCSKDEDEGYVCKVNLMRQREASSAFDFSFQRCFINCDGRREGKSILSCPFLLMRYIDNMFNNVSTVRCYRTGRAIKSRFFMYEAVSKKRLN